MSEKKTDGLVRSFLLRAFSFNLKEFVLICLGALAIFFAFPNPFIQIPILIFLAPFALYSLIIGANSTLKAATATFLCTLIGSSFSLYWLALPMHDFAGVPWVLSSLAVLSMGLYISLYGLFFAVFVRSIHPHFSFLASAFLSALAWGALEYFRGFIFTGFTWLSASSALAGWPELAQGAALLGMFGLSVIVFFIGNLLAVTFLLPASFKKRTVSFSLALIFLISLYLCGPILQKNIPEPIGKVNAVLVQGNIDQMQKWDQQRYLQTLSIYLRLSAKALADHEGQDAIVIWPETSVPFLYGYYERFDNILRGFAQRAKVELLFGSPGRDYGPVGQLEYNSVFLIDKNGEDKGRYDKEHLVPFGEYVPLGLYIPFASEFLQGFAFTPGDNSQTVDSEQADIGMLICYEAIFPELAQTRVEAGANVLVTVSNDAWFGISSGPAQHLQLAAMRAIEQGRDMFRSTNTGYTAMIDRHGEIYNRSPLFQEWSGFYTAKLYDDKTIFNRYYKIIHLFLWCMPLLALVISLLRGIWTKKNNP